MTKMTEPSNPAKPPQSAPEPLRVGDRFPEVTLTAFEGGEVVQVPTAELCRGKKIALFAVPGAFTPTCSERHLPSFLEHAAEFAARGAAAVVCVAVNDHYVMTAWGQVRGVGSAIRMLGDGNGELAQAMGLLGDSCRFGLGMRSRRYAAWIDDGALRALLVDEPGRYEASSAERLLQAIDAIG